MSRNIKTIVTVIVLIIIVIILWLWYAGSSLAPASNTSVPGGDQTSLDGAAAVGLTTSPTDSSDTALESDLNSVDAQMSALDADTAGIPNQ